MMSLYSNIKLIRLKVIINVSNSLTKHDDRDLRWTTLPRQKNTEHNFR